ncbi:adhesion G protein-coupled receptor B1-like [Amphiura filiformis]|uniref:adhesion G protein-coupled receptor B1-like n=1 Tax=Amphiura filiformis TaxID=82378 RepID=UPI003B228467
MELLLYFVTLSCVTLQSALAQIPDNLPPDNPPPTGVGDVFNFQQPAYVVQEGTDQLIVKIERTSDVLLRLGATVDVSSDGSIPIGGQSRVRFLPGDETADLVLNLANIDVPNSDIVGILSLFNPQVDDDPLLDNNNTPPATIGNLGSTEITITNVDNVDNEPVWSQWSEYSECSVACGSGTRIRTRACNDPNPDDNNSDCVGDSMETESCTAETSCPAWSSWSYSECSVTCGSGTRTRTRTCVDPDPSDDITTCSGDSQEPADCATQIPCTGEPVWSEWSEYSACTVSCGGGRQTRLRECLDTNKQDDVTCTPGSSQETTDCNTQLCQNEANTVFFQQPTYKTVESIGSFFVEVQRTSFANGATVGIRRTGDLQLNTDQITFLPGVSAVRIQIFVIDDNFPEPDVLASLILHDHSDGTIGIPGNLAITIEDDDEGPPPGWTSWSGWSGCDTSCGIGAESRTRTCVGSSEDCIGDNTQSQICNTQVVCPEWNDWGQWSGCSSTCGSFGSRIRTRTCNNFGTGNSCQGSNTESGRCNRQACPMTCASDVEVTPYGRLRAPDGQVGSTYLSEAVCPWYTRNEGNPIGRATCVRRNGITFWDWIVDCGGDKSTKQKLNVILGRPITSENAEATLDDICNLLTDRPNDVNAECVSNVIDILGDVVDLQLPDREVTDKVIDVVDKLCLVDPDVLMAEQSTSNAMKLIEKQLKVVEIERQDIGEWPYRRVTDTCNIATEVYWASNEELCRGLYVASSSGPGVPRNDLLTRVRQSSTVIDVEIEVPPEICDRYPNGARVVLDVFADDKLLPSSTLQTTNEAQNLYNRVVNSPVISVTVGDQEVRGLQEPVRLLFNPLEIHSNNTQCVYWDCTRNDWSSEGCRYLGETPNWQRICDCDHLTSFAVLMDIYSDTTTGGFNWVIFVIVISCLAVLGLVLVLLACFYVWYLRERRRAFRRGNARMCHNTRRHFKKERVIARSHPRF